MAIMKPDLEAKPPTPVDSKESYAARQQRMLAEAGYTHREGAPQPLPLDPPTFSLKELRAAVPPHCFERSALKSSVHLVKDLIKVAILFYLSTWISIIPYTFLRIALWCTYWFLQGTFLTGVWVIAHECGHQAFSPSETINNTVGLILHSALLVPYHSWRITHRRHHSNTGSCENDEVFAPITRTEHDEQGWDDHLEDSPLYNFYKIFMMLWIGWMPGYLFFNATGPAKYHGKPVSHFNPNAVMFNDRERWMVIVSDIGMGIAVLILGGLIYEFGFLIMLQYYFVPYMITNAYLVLITYLQHTDTFIPHFREVEWNWLRGALCTVDRSFGSFIDDAIHHISDTHVAHHIFSKMPFYHAEEATKALIPILGKYYLKDKTPVPLALWRSYKYCKFIQDDGNIVFYRKRDLPSKGA